MRRHPTAYTSSFSAGPGPLSTAIKAIIVANVVLFFASAFSRTIIDELGLVPFLFLHELRLWQPVTYMFLHAGIFHILFNMLGLWMIGTELERIWGTRYFVKFYFVTGIGAGLLTVVFSLLPFGFARQVYGSNIIGASGAIYGLLLGLCAVLSRTGRFTCLPVPDPGEVFRHDPRRDRVLLVARNSGGVANATHLGGLVVGYVYLKGAREHPISELKYRYLKWKINRMRRKFDVYSGGRANDWDRRIH